MRYFIIVFFVLYGTAVFAEPGSQFVWVAGDSPWSKISTAPPTIEMTPTKLVPEGASPEILRRVLTRVLGRSLGGLVPGVGVVYAVKSFAEDYEQRRERMVYAMQQLKREGIPVTAKNIHEWIANDHGIDTTNPEGFLSDTVFVHEGVQYNLEPWGGHSSLRLSPPDVVISPGYIHVYWKPWSGGAKSYFKTYAVISTEPAPDGFNPENYPDLYSPENFPGNIVDAIINRDPDTFTLEMGVPEEPIEAVWIDVEAIDPTPEDQETDTIIDNNGFRYKVPSELFSSVDIPEVQIPKKVVHLQTELGRTSLSGSESTEFLNAGMPSGSVITSVNPKTGGVTYQDPVTGEKKYVNVPPSVAQNLSNNYRIYNTYNNSTEITNIHEELVLPTVVVSGELKIPNNSTLEPVKEDRVEASRQKFFAALQNLIDQYSNIFELNLSGIGKLPVWHWVLMGHTVTIDFNDYATELNWIGLAVVLIATISAVFIVFD